MLETTQMQSSDARKLGFLVSGILLGLLFNVLATGFGADRVLAYGIAAIPVLGSLALAVFSPGPKRPPLTEEQRRQRMRSIAIALCFTPRRLFASANKLLTGRIEGSDRKD
jgi:hypothetical protein